MVAKTKTEKPKKIKLCGIEYYNPCITRTTLHKCTLESGHKPPHHNGTTPSVVHDRDALETEKMVRSWFSEKRPRS